jgi:phospholipid/cholesterol/gamma-HCH transport system permease protein
MTRRRLKDCVDQLDFVAIQSAPIIAFCVCFAAVVTVIESAYHMKLVVHDVSLVPGFASLFILRELGVVIASLLVTSRVGAGITAEVATMEVTEQIGALKMLGINPVYYILLPRLVACVLGCVILSVIANATCLLGAVLVSESKIGYTAGEFLTAMRRFVEMRDVFFSALKGAVFGALIPLISCFFGFRCRSGAEGVGLATTNSVVASSVAIIFADFVLTYVLSHFY